MLTKPTAYPVNITASNSMTQDMHSDSLRRETFQSFFDFWLTEVNSNLQKLVFAANRRNETDDGTVEEDAVVRRLVDKVIQHYELFYEAKSSRAKGDAISMLSPTWLSKLEDAFLWIGGWRPTTAIHLLYSKSSIQLEAKLAEMIRGVTAGDLSELTSSQLNRVNEIQKKIIREERAITEKMAAQQERVADMSMVDLSNVASEIIRRDGGGESENDRRIESELESKNKGLEEVLKMADDLRMGTLKSVIEILTPIQAVYFLIAAAELHLRLHDWGKKRDEACALEPRYGV